MPVDHVTAVGATLSRQIKEGNAPWMQQWPSGARFAPFNPVSSAAYQGPNSVWLMATATERGFKDPRWMTKKQIEDLGGSLKSGEPGTTIHKWATEGREPVVDEQGQAVVNERGQPVLRTVRYEQPMLFSASVFNAEQARGLPDLDLGPRSDVDARRRLVVGLLRASGAKIEFAERAQPHFDRARDVLQLRSLDDASAGDTAIRTALRGVALWTAGEKRLNRKGGHPAGSPGAAVEEMRVAMATLALGDRFGAGYEPVGRDIYRDAWAAMVERDPKVLFQAGAQAQEVTRTVRGYEIVAERKAELVAQRDATQARLQELGIKEEVVSKNTADTGAADRIYLQVPFSEREEAKAAGARWDGAAKKWFATPDMAEETLRRWRSEPARNGADDDATPQPAPRRERVALLVPYLERQVAKDAGARFDWGSKSWYAGADADLTALAKWIPVPGPEVPARPEQKTPKDLFTGSTADALEHAGELLAGKRSPLGWGTTAAAFEANPGKVTSAMFVALLAEATAAKVDEQAVLARFPNALQEAEVILQTLDRTHPALVAALPFTLKPLTKASDRDSPKELEPSSDAKTSGREPSAAPGADTRQTESPRLGGIDIQTVTQGQAGPAVPEDPEVARPVVIVPPAGQEVVDAGEPGVSASVVVQERSLEQTPQPDVAFQGQEASRDANGHGVDRARMERGPETIGLGARFLSAVRGAFRLRSRSPAEAEAAAVRLEQEDRSQEQEPQAAARLPEPVDVVERAEEVVPSEPPVEVSPPVEAPTIILEAAEAEQLPPQETYIEPVVGRVEADVERKGAVSEERVYLNVPFDERERAKVAGARWDREVRAWYAQPGKDLAQFQQWLSPSGGTIQDPRTSFEDACRDAGLQLKGGAIMDGRHHRVLTVGDRKGQKSGSYRADEKGGFIHNFRTGVGTPWRGPALGSSIDPAERAKVAAQVAEEKRQRDQARLARHEEVAVLSSLEWERAGSAHKHAYLDKKEVTGSGLRMDDRGTLIIPMQDDDGRVWNVQRIPANKNIKLFGPSKAQGWGTEKDGRVEGLHASFGDPEKPGPLIVTEGVATGKSIHEATGAFVRVAFNAGNLLAVTKGLRDRYPGREIVLAADNDDHLPRRMNPDGSPMVNVGVHRAEEAAKAVKGLVVIPQTLDPKGEANLEVYKGTDWNDVHIAKGHPEMAREFADALVMSRRRELVVHVGDERTQAVHERDRVEAQRQDMERILQRERLRGGQSHSR